MSPLLEAETVSLRVGSKTLLDNINIAFDRAEGVALIGPNGAGKSTLLRTLSGELRPQIGSVRLNGRALASYAPQALATQRAVLSQQVNIAFPFSVTDVVSMGVSQCQDDRTKELIHATLAELDLFDLAHRSINTLSGGEQQRVHFARVLVQHAYGKDHGNSGILLLDEPTASLDLHHQLDMLNVLKRRVDSGALVIGVFHDLNLAVLFAKRIIILYRGHIDSDGAIDQTINDAMMKRTFAINTIVGSTPAAGMPFFLPQTMSPTSDLSS